MSFYKGNSSFQPAPNQEIEQHQGCIMFIKPSHHPYLQDYNASSPGSLDSFNCTYLVTIPLRKFQKILISSLLTSKPSAGFSPSFPAQNRNQQMICYLLFPECELQLLALSAPQIETPPESSTCLNPSILQLSAHAPHYFSRSSLLSQLSQAPSMAER